MLIQIDIFKARNRTLGTQMKATGEIMAIGRTFEESLLKGIRSLDSGTEDLWLKDIAQLPLDVIKERLIEADDERIFVIAEAVRRELTVAYIHLITKINNYFMNKIKQMIDLEHQLQETSLTN